MDGTKLSRGGRSPQELLISFLDLARFTAIFQRVPDDRTADGLDRFYALVQAAMDRSGGRVIKYMGDGAMLCWPPQRADDALASLVALRAEVKAWAAAEGWETALIVRLHCGTVIAGDFGPAGHAQFDLLGNAVAVAARLQAQTISVSADAFRRLSPESRQLLKKHTPPVVYIPLNDPRP